MGKESISSYLKDQPSLGQKTTSETNTNVKPEETIVKTQVDKKEWYFLMGFSIPTIIISTVSSIHLVDWFLIGNSTVMSWALAFAFEISVVGMLFGLSVLKRLGKGSVYFMLFVIFTMQVFGNVFSVYLNYTQDPQFLSTITSFFDFKWTKVSKFWISMIIGVPLPLVSFLMMKSIANYFDDEYQYKPKRRNY